MDLLDWLVILGGVVVVTSTALSAARTVVLPHGRPVRITRFVFRSSRAVVRAAARFTSDNRRRHAVLSANAPIALLSLPLVWLSLALGGFTLIFWGLDTKPVSAAFKLAGSSMLTLGFFDVDDTPRLVVAFFAAALTISVLGILLVTYLPTIYTAYSSRETTITALESFAGEPPRAPEMLSRMYRIGGWERLDEIWTEWRLWFAEAQETHTALPALALFQSSHPNRSWVGAVGVVLDAAALKVALTDAFDAEAQLCIRSGFLTLREIARSFDFEFDPDPRPDDPISVSREEFDRVVAELEGVGIELQQDLDDAWIAFAGWRVNYDTVLNQMAELVGARDVTLERLSLAP